MGPRPCSLVARLGSLLWVWLGRVWWGRLRHIRGVVGAQDRQPEPRAGGVMAAGGGWGLGALGGITGQSEVVLWEGERVMG